MKKLVSIILLCAGPALAWDTVRLAVPTVAHESDWRDALAAAWTGRTEVAIRYGRVDVLTPSQAIELDYSHKYHEALGQALHYADETGRQGVAALIVDSQIDPVKMEWIERWMNRHNVKMVVLMRGRESINP